MAQRLRYSSFADNLDLDALYEAIGFEPFAEDRGNDIGHCIWPENHKHGDTSGKFAVHRERRVFNCFVCGGGDLLTLAMLATGKDVEEATVWLHQFATLEGRTDQEFADYLISMLEDVEERTETLPYFNARVLDRYDDETNYFTEKGIGPEVVQEMGLRFKLDAFKMAPIKTSREGEKIKPDDDYVGPASIWPHYWQGRLVGWQYRWHEWDPEHTRTPQWLPKWTNTADFPKRTTLYNYDNVLRVGQPIVVIESSRTVNFLKTYGYPAVGWFGSKPTDQQLRLLRRFQQGVILAPDNDSNQAGDKIYKTVEYLARFIPVRVADKVWPDDVGLDPDDEEADGLDLGDYVRVENPGAKLWEHLELRVSDDPSLELR